MPPRKPPTQDETCATVRAIYADLDKRPIHRDCIRRTECCQFKLTGRTPYLTRAEAVLAVKAFRDTGRSRLPASADGVCPMLDRPSGKCLIYADRPFGCRTHFCQAAGGPYARREVVDLIHRLEDASDAIGGGEARELPDAMAEELANQTGPFASFPKKAPPRSRSRQ